MQDLHRRRSFLRSIYLLRWVVRAEAGFEAQEEMKAFVESFRLLD